jgi:hypothetical protein
MGGGARGVCAQMQAYDLNCTTALPAAATP